MTQGNQEPFSAMEKKSEDLKTEELAEQEFEKFGSFFKQLAAFRRRELIGDFYKMCNGYYRLEPAGVTSVVPNPRGRPAMKFSGATKTSTKRDMSCFEVEDAIAAHKKNWEEHERHKPMMAPLPSAPIVNQGISKTYNLRTRSQSPSNSIPESPFHTRGSSTRSSSFDGKQKDLYKSPYLTDDLIASTSFQSSSKKADEQDQKSKFGVERTIVKNLYQSPVVKASLSEYAASSSKEDISRLEEGDLVSRKSSMSRRTSVVGSLLPTRMPSISAGTTTHLPIKHTQELSDDRDQLITSALKYTAAACTLLGDPNFLNGTKILQFKKFTSKSFANQIFKKIVDKQTYGFLHYNPHYDHQEDHGTTHLTVIDWMGSTISLTSTINPIFGSELMDQRTGIILKNELDDFSIPGRWNDFNLSASPLNYPEKGKRPISSISPVIFERPDGETWCSLLGSGGSRILSFIISTILKLDWGSTF
ncbi:gamma-glutamyltranspeptidase-domain-containing protein [Phakopsora pachyrhizi]|nr:gamma-glutamyltranspeptidase-domain-containing protein [Phakopsora pachyrhizi]